MKSLFVAGLGVLVIGAVLLLLWRRRRPLVQQTPPNLGDTDLGKTDSVADPSQEKASQDLSQKSFTPPTPESGPSAPEQGLGAPPRAAHPKEPEEARHGAGAHQPHQLPMGPQQRRRMLQYLRAALEQGPEMRLSAMEDMVAWGDPACLPLLRRGLRDGDIRVVGLAARGLERFRGPRKHLRKPSQGRPRHPLGRPSPPA